MPIPEVMAGSDAVKARAAIVAQLEKDNCTDTAKTRCQVVSLYGGAQTSRTSEYLR